MSFLTLLFFPLGLLALPFILLYMLLLRRRIKTLLAPLLLLLAACNSSQIEALPTETAVPPRPTATTTPLPIFTSSPTTVIEPTAIVTPTSTPEQIPRSTPANDTEGNDNLPPIPSQVENGEFQLHTPIPDILMQLSAYTLAQQKAFKELPPPEQADVVESEIISLFNLIERDTKDFDPQGFTVSTESITHPLEWSFESRKTLWAIWQAYTLHTLNENQIDLPNQTELETPLAPLSILQMIQKDNGDSTWLLLVNPELEENFWSFLLPVTKKADGQYYLLPNDLTNPYYLDAINISSNVDVTGDGQQDIIIEIGGGGVFSHRLEVYSWDDLSLSLLTVIDAENGKYTPSPQIDIDDFNNDGVSDIRLTHQKWMDLGCQYEEVELYSWQGAELHYTQISNIDTQSECDASRAITQNLSSQSVYIGDVILSPEILTIDERITLLTRRLANVTIESSPFTDYIPLLRIHLSMAYLGNGENELAQTTFASISNLPNTTFTTAVEEVSRSTEGDLLSICRLMYQGEWPRHLNMDENYDLLSRLGLLRNYGYPVTALERRICPYPMVITGLLNRLNLPSNLPPEDLFPANNIEILYQQEFNIDNDPETEWLIIVEPEAPQVLILDNVNDNWQLYHLMELIPPITDLQFQAIDEPINGNPQLLLQATQNIYSWFCWGDQQTDILTIGFSDDKYELLDRDIACGNDSLPLYSDQLANSFFESPDEYFFLQQINQIEEIILSGDNPLSEIQSRLDDLIEKIPDNTGHYQMMRHRVLYLRGLTYELSGNDATAVPTYLDLIQHYPNSPWSWLAWARLEPTEQ